MNNKALTSKVLGFIAMGMSIISIPMLFLPIVNLWIVDITMIDIFKLSEFASDEIFVPIMCIVSMVLALIGAILIPFTKKIFKIFGCVLNSLAFLVSMALIIVVFATDIAEPGIGLWLNAAILLISMALSIAAAVMTPKAGTAEMYTPPIDRDNGWKQSGVPLAHGGITFLSGSCAGYQVPINGGDELIIGKDPAQCAIVIDKKYTKVSRKHCGVRFDPMQNIYIVTDYSTNGTSIVGGAKLANGSASYLESGTTINLAKTENSFRLD